MKMPRITPFLMFDNQAEEAMELYTSIFKNSKVTKTSRYGKGAPLPEGTLMSASFSLDELDFHAFNAGPYFKFSEGISLYVDCKDQAEVDYYWNAFTKEGSESMCGWLKDKFGVSWQIIPEALPRLLNDPDTARAGRAMQAMMQMQKIDAAKLEAAANG
jgi:predicted 3-demethylubiquinone-9 3-methyltransferase (glyoxalase superfamily)